LSARTITKLSEALGLKDLDPQSGKIFLTGGTNCVIGHRVALRLLDAGYPDLRLGARNFAQMEEMGKRGAEITYFSWVEQESYDKALKGVHSVLLTIPYQDNWFKHFPAFLEACERAGVKHIVKLSFYHSTIEGDTFQDVPLVKHHGEADKMLMQMVDPDPEVLFTGMADVDVVVQTPYHPDMKYNLIHGSHFMSNAFMFQGKELRDQNVPSTFYGCSGTRGVNYVSPNDIAEAAVRVLLEPKKHYNKAYTLTGPTSITDQEVADLLSKYLKKPVMYVDQPERIFETELKVSGDPSWKVQDLVALEKIKASGSEEDHKFLSQDFEELCGHPSESYEHYLQMTNAMTPIEAGM